MSSILIIGGYGNTGRQIARLLLEGTEVAHVIIAGRNLSRARQEAQELRCHFPHRQIEALELDVSNRPILADVFSRADLIVNAASTISQTEIIARALLESGRDYLDTQLSSLDKLNVLRDYAWDFDAAGICCITDGGFHPGLPAALIRYLAQRMSDLQEARVFSVIRFHLRDQSVSDSTSREMLDEFRHFQPLEYRRGKWRKRSFFRPKYHDFGPRFGRQACMPMHLTEMEDLPHLWSTLQETGFYVTGFNPLVDYLLMPLIGTLVWVWPRPWQRPLGHLLQWGINRTSPPYGVQLDVECRGKRYGQDSRVSLRLFHPNAYAMTAAPVVATIKQWLQGDLRRPGLWYQGLAVNPTQLMADLRLFEIDIEVNWQME